MNTPPASSVPTSDQDFRSHDLRMPSDGESLKDMESAAADGSIDDTNKKGPETTKPEMADDGTNGMSTETQSPVGNDKARRCLSAKRVVKTIIGLSVQTLMQFYDHAFCVLDMLCPEGRSATFIPNAQLQAPYSVLSASSSRNANLIAGDVPILFLDVDGVLHSAGPGPELLPQCVMLVRSVVMTTQAKIILSSTWRLHADEVRKLQDNGLHIYGVTRDLGRGMESRVDEILEWVEKYQAKKWVVLDDMDLLDNERYANSPAMKNHFVRTDMRDGIQGISQSDADEAISLMNGQCGSPANE